MTDQELKDIEAQANALLESYDCPEIAKSTARDIPKLIKAIKDVRAIYKAYLEDDSPEGAVSSRQVLRWIGEVLGCDTKPES